MRKIAVTVFLAALNMVQVAVAASATAIFSVPGLDCTGWPLSLTPVVRTVRAVTDVRVDLDRRRLRVDFDDSQADPNDIVHSLKSIWSSATLVGIKKAAGPT